MSEAQDSVPAEAFASLRNAAFTRWNGLPRTRKLHRSRVNSPRETNKAENMAPPNSL